MTNKIDWDKGPEGAEFFADGCFWRDGDCRWFPTSRTWQGSVIVDAEHYKDYCKRPQPKPSAKHPATSAEYLAACAQVQSERAKQYDASGTGERSFEAAAEAFNCVTGKNLRGSDVCLILEMVKLVRQYSNPTRLHEDSVLDKVSYSALWAEEITKELG